MQFLLLLADGGTITENTGWSGGLIIGVVVAAVGVVGVIVEGLRRANSNSEARHEATRKWVEETFIRCDVHEQEHKSLDDKVGGMERKLEVRDSVKHTEQMVRELHQAQFQRGKSHDDRTRGD